MPRTDAREEREEQRKQGGKRLTSGTRMEEAGGGADITKRDESRHSSGCVFNFAQASVCASVGCCGGLWSSYH